MTSAHTIAQAVVASSRELKVCPILAVKAPHHHPAKRALAPAILGLRSAGEGTLDGLCRILNVNRRGVQRARTRWFCGDANVAAYVAARRAVMGEWA